jgi:hypothetical protein
MDRSSNKLVRRPARCPSCGSVVQLLVSHSGRVTVQFHNVNGCNKTFFYRCWIEDGLPLPRVEFLDEKNAMHFALHPQPNGDDPATTDTPTPVPISASPRSPAPSERRVPNRQPPSADFKRRGRPRMHA